MSLVKRLLRSQAAVSLAASIIAGYIRFVRATSRWQTLGAEHVENLWQTRQPAVIAFWHGRLLLLPTAWRGSSMTMHMLISQHRDGELIARSTHSFGMGTVRGSSANPKKAGKEKGGQAALRALLHLLKAGHCVGFTPDGPRGPRMRAGPGVVATARLARVPILPIAYATRRRKLLRSWDRFHLALPFTSGVIIWGAPLDVHSDAGESLEAAALRLEQALNAITDEADRLCGHAPVPPAPREGSNA